jgi:tripartite-type tricarboxylate transporter receptor subunit TctC
MRIVVLLLALLLAGGAAAEDFYKGKQIRLIVGSESGAGYDAYARLLARHMPRHIPGNPPIVPQYMPGASSLVAANYLYNLAPRDGTVFGTFQRDLPLAALLDSRKEQVKFDASKFTWLGSASSGRDDAYLMVMRAELPVKSIADIRGAGKASLVLAATAPGAQSYDVPAALKEILGLNLQIVAAYPSAAQMVLALMRKEVDARMIGLSSMLATQPEWLRDGVVRVLLQFGRADRHKLLPQVPTAQELAANEADRSLIELMETSQLLSWPFAAPPDLPAEQAATLERAFLETQQDPAYLADAAQAKMELSPIGGAEIAARLKRLYALPPALIARYNQLLAKTER